MRKFALAIAYLPTAYIVRREGYVLTPVCPSVCSHLGGTPARSRWGRGTPARSDGGGVPHPGYPPSDLAGGYPISGTPLVDLARGGTPAGGVTPTWVPPVRPGQGGIPAGGCIPPRYPPCQTWPEGTPPWVPPPSDLGRAYPISGKRFST